VELRAGMKMSWVAKTVSERADQGSLRVS